MVMRVGWTGPCYLLDNSRRPDLPALAPWSDGCLSATQGVPVYVERSGMLDMNAVLAKGTTVDELVRLHVVSMEVFPSPPDCSVERGAGVTRVHLERCGRAGY